MDLEEVTWVASYPHFGKVKFIKIDEDRYYYGRNEGKH